MVDGHKPDLAIVDVRLPPTFTDEGMRAAIERASASPGSAILILSQYVEPAYTAELLATGDGGRRLPAQGAGRRGRARSSTPCGRVADGGTALDPEVVAQLLRAARRPATSALDALTPREREVLALMAEGRTNARSRARSSSRGGAVEKHISSIFAKLDLAATDDDHRRVLAVLAYLRAT